MMWECVGWCLIHSYFYFVLHPTKRISYRDRHEKIHHLGFAWTENGWMLLHQGTQVLINSIDAVANKPTLQTITNIEVSACSIVNISMRKSGICNTNTSCTYEIQVNKILTIQIINHVTNNTFKKRKLNYIECQSPKYICQIIWYKSWSIPLLHPSKYTLTTMKTKMLLTWR